MSIPARDLVWGSVTSRVALRARKYAAICFTERVVDHRIWAIVFSGLCHRLSNTVRRLLQS